MKKAIAIVALGVLAVGCPPPVTDSVVGRWEYETTVLGQPLFVEFDFASDGSYAWGAAIFLADGTPIGGIFETGWYETFDTVPARIHIHANEENTVSVEGSEDAGPHDHYYIYEISGNTFSLGHGVDDDEYPASWGTVSETETFQRITKIAVSEIATQP